jgi:hypothetical protein
MLDGNLRMEIKQLFNEKTPDKLNQWLDDVWSGKVAYTKDLNSWLFIAQSIYQNVLNDPEIENNIPSKSWAATSISIYEYLDKCSDSEFDSSMYSANNIRIKLIEHFGNIKGDYVCDVDSIYDWFFNSITMTLKEVKQKSIGWGSNIVELSRDSDEYKHAFKNIRELRAIKNKLNVIQSLYQLGYKPDGYDIEPWIQIKADLP